MGFREEEYFSNPKDIELCRAIRKNDIAGMRQAVAEGADVNAIGVGNVTPLLWAFFDNKLERFQWLLEHGANPNVFCEIDFCSAGFSSKGLAVTHEASKTSFPGYFEAVFKNGGDPNLMRKDHEPLLPGNPLFMNLRAVIDADKKIEHIKILAAKGADMNYIDPVGNNAAMKSVTLEGNYRIILCLLNAGTSHRTRQYKRASRLIHMILRHERVSHYPLSERDKADRVLLFSRLKELGESEEAANADLARWESWGSPDTPSFWRKMEDEIAEIVAKENNKKPKKKDAKDWGMLE